MAQVCPISTRRVDSNMVRVISFQVALFSVLLLLTQESFFALILLFDFFMRTIRKQNLSPFHMVGKFILSGWGVTPKLCDESPKRFALYLGLIISFFLVLFFVAELTSIAIGITAILFICALMETLFDYCIGCKIYYAIQIMNSMKDHKRS